MGNSIPALRTDTVNGCIIKGEYTVLPDKYYDFSRVQFKNGVNVYIPKQTSDGAVITCETSNDGSSVSVTVENLIGATILGSDKTDYVTAVNCKNCIFDTARDGKVADNVSIYNDVRYVGNNRMYLGENDKGRVENYANCNKTIGIFDAAKINN